MSFKSLRKQTPPKKQPSPSSKPNNSVTLKGGKEAKPGAWNIIKNPRSGRTRISQACDRCRARKIKCSGKSESHPRCTNCERDGFQCIVSDKLTRNSFPKGYTKNLEKKLLEVELDRNKLSLELKELRKKLTTEQPEHSKINEQSKHTIQLQQPSKAFETNSDGLLNLSQYIVYPFNEFLEKLPLKEFKRKKSRSRRLSQDIKANAEDTTDNKPYGCKGDPEMTVLTNYHMNLNRYLNLVFYQLILPTFSVGTSDNKGRFSPNNKARNLDHLIWMFFNVYNKLVPILDFELFYNDYLTFINKYTLKNSTYIEDGEIKRRYYTFTVKEQNILIKLILIMKFTMARPKSSIQTGGTAGQLQEAVKLINLKNLKLLLGNINFTTDLTLDKLEIALMLLYFLIKFVNYNVLPPSQMQSSETMFKVNFLRDVIQLCFHLKNSLHVSFSTGYVVIPSQLGLNEQIITIQRLKLYWDFRILMRLSEAYFNIDFERVSSGVIEQETTSDSLESIKYVCPDIGVTLQFVKLLKIVPKNILQLSVESNIDKLKNFDDNINSWLADVNKLQNDENALAIRKLKTYYHYFKVLIRLHSPAKELKKELVAFTETGCDLVSPDKDIEISMDNVELLCLHSFDFHLLFMMSIIMLASSGDMSKACKDRLARVFQLYQLLITVNQMDPVICELVKYASESMPSNMVNSNSNHDALQIYSLTVGGPTTSPFINCPTLPTAAVKRPFPQATASFLQEPSIPFKQMRSNSNTEAKNISPAAIPSLFNPSNSFNTKKEDVGLSLFGPKYNFSTGFAKEARGRSLSVDSRVLGRKEMDGTNSTFGKCPSENGSIDKNTAPVTFSGIFGDVGGLRLNEFRYQPDKLITDDTNGSSDPLAKSVLPTIPSETNLEASLAREAAAQNGDNCRTVPNTFFGASNNIDRKGKQGHYSGEGDDLQKIRDRSLHLKASS